MAKEIWCIKLDQYVDPQYCKNKCLYGVCGETGDTECVLDDE